MAALTKRQWKNLIRKYTEQAGTYREYFDCVIDTLAGIMVTRDEAEKKWRDDGGQTVVEHTNKSGAKNLVKHPSLVLVNDLNRDALAYWRDLGLTPAGLKRINEEAMGSKGKDAPSFADVLKDIGI